MVKDDALKDLEREIERAPGIVRVKKRKERGSVEPEGIAKRMLFNDPARMLATGAGKETRQSSRLTISSGKVGYVVGLVRKERYFSSHRRIDGKAEDFTHGIVEVAGEDIRPIVLKKKLNGCWQWRPDASCETKGAGSRR